MFVACSLCSATHLHGSCSHTCGDCNDKRSVYDLHLIFISFFKTQFTCLIDRVFGSESTTKQVYEEAAKEVALSVVSGINCE